MPFSTVIFITGTTRVMKGRGLRPPIQINQTNFKLHFNGSQNRTDVTSKNIKHDTCFLFLCCFRSYIMTDFCRLLISLHMSNTKVKTATVAMKASWSLTQWPLLFGFICVRNSALFTSSKRRMGTQHNGNNDVYFSRRIIETIYLSICCIFPPWQTVCCAAK